jgi:two-component system sensor histidine kinase VicK
VKPFSLDGGIMKKSLTIRSKLFIAIVAILASSYSILLFSSLTSIQNFTEDEIVKDLEAALKFAKSEFNKRPEIVLEALKIAVSTQSAQKYFSDSNNNNFKDSVKLWNKSFDFLDMITLVDTHQKVIARINGNREGKTFLKGHLLSITYDRRQPFITTELISSEEFCREVSNDLCQALPENRDVMVQLVVIPVIDAKETVLGALVAGDVVNKDSYLPYQQQKIFGKNVEMLITQMGERIASTFGAADTLTSNVDNRVTQALKSGFSYNGEAILDNRPYEMVAEPINNLKGDFIGMIAVALEKKEFSDIRDDNLRNLFLSAAFSIPLIFILAFFAARQFSLPIRRLSDAVLSVEAGDFSMRLENPGGDEFGILTDAFNRMTASLAERDTIITGKSAELEELNKALEIRVMERTEQLKVEGGKHQAILKSLLEGVLVTDSEHRIIHSNPAADKLLGVQIEEMNGKPVEELCRKLGIIELAKRIESVPYDEVGSEANIFLTHDKRKLRMEITPLLDEADLYRGLVLSIRDVTAEGEIDRMKSEFIATISHEFKTPLTSMKGSLQFILNKGKWLTGIEREMLTVCLRNTERLIRLIVGILDISRMEADISPFVMRPTPPAELVLYAVENIKGTALSRNISIVNDVGFELPQILGDHDRLIQLLYNLLSNAVKFSPADSVINIQAERQGNFVAISVADDGKVIRSSDRDRLFSKFQQFDQAEGGELGGTGLGLAICRVIAEKHGGTIYYSAGAGGGNIFTFTIPVYGEKDVG